MFTHKLYALVRYATLFSLVSIANAQFRRVIPTVLETGTTRYLESHSYFPLKEITALIGQDAGVLVSYEDPWYDRDQTEDISAASWRKDHPNEIGFYVPKWSTLAISYEKPLRQPEAVESVLRSAIGKYNATHPAIRFELVRLGQRSYAVSGHDNSGKAIGDHIVNPHFEKPWPASKALAIIVNSCSTAAGVRIEMGTVPLNLLATTTVNFDDRPRTCREWIQEVILATRATLVYQINVDISDKLYGLNIEPPKATVIF